MLSLFSTHSDTAGFRLEYMELLNWGTFDGEIVRINPQGNNSLLTGANASGKSTFIDALLTLMVPLRRNRFYNQSSGVEKKGDRTEETYVLGYYGKIQEEGKSTTSTQKLRDYNTFSVVLAHFKNTAGKKVTIFQLRWFVGRELKRQFGIAHIPLEIKKDFSSYFDSVKTLKKRLEKTYNTNTSRRKIEFINGTNAYAERMVQLFGMRSVKALSLFNQVVGVKVLDDLDEFIRTNMLEDKDAESEFNELKSSFLNLMDAKNNIEKAKEQIKQLTPINEIAIRLNEIKEQLSKIEKTKQSAVYWFAKKGVELGEKELEKCKEELGNLNEELTALREKETALKEQERSISLAMERDEVGSQIKKLKSEISRLKKSKDLRSKKLDEYNQLVQELNLDSNPTEEIFLESRENSKELKKNTGQKIEEETENLRILKNKGDDLQKATDELVKTIQTLQKNKNNITGRDAEIREELIESIGATKEEIPFVGELIKVKGNEQEWEHSIEKVLHNFGLRLIVPKEYYKLVNKYVNNRNLRGIIRYDKYEEVDFLKNFRQQNSNEKSLIRKVKIKSTTPYVEWIENNLERQFNFTCVDNLAEFNEHSEMAITQNGLIKYKRGRHEKDDRKHVFDRKNYVLGWDNKEKIKSLRESLKFLQKEQKQNKKDISFKSIKIEELGLKKDNYHDLFSKYAKFDDINWQFYANEIQEKNKQKEELEKTDDKYKKLQEQLDKVKKDLKNLSEIEIEDKVILKGKKQTEINDIDDKLKQNHQLYNALGNIDISAFELKYTELENITYANFESVREDFQEQNSDKANKLNNEKYKKENTVRNQINDFKRPTENITNKYPDWRSDVNSLPESTNLEFIGEYQQFLDKLQKDNLPKFEKKFNDYLQKTITDKIGDFRIFFYNWSDSIKDNINDLNQSLKEIDFKNNPKTYIQLIASNRIDNDIKAFKTLLNNAVPNIGQTDTMDTRKYHFENHIQPLISTLDNEEWRKKVSDVRTWFNYKAEEFYKEGDVKFKTYENMGALSGGQKAQLTYTILGSAIAYQFGLTNVNEGLDPQSFRFIAIDEAFKAQDEDKAKFLLTLCKQLHLQLLVVTPLNDLKIVQDAISFVHYVEIKDEKHSRLVNMPIEQLLENQKAYLENDNATRN